MKAQAQAHAAEKAEIERFVLIKFVVEYVVSATNVKICVLILGERIKMWR